MRLTVLSVALCVACQHAPAPRDQRSPRPAPPPAGEPDTRGAELEAVARHVCDAVGARARGYKYCVRLGYSDPTPAELTSLSAYCGSASYQAASVCRHEVDQGAPERTLLTTTAIVTSKGGLMVNVTATPVSRRTSFDDTPPGASYVFFREADRWVYSFKGDIPFTREEAEASEQRKARRLTTR